jgi:hypothetical protein
MAIQTHIILFAYFIIYRREVKSKRKLNFLTFYLSGNVLRTKARKRRKKKRRQVNVKLN